MIEYSIAQFIGLSNLLMLFCEKNKLSIMDMQFCSVRLHEPLDGGSIKLDIGFPASFDISRIKA